MQPCDSIEKFQPPNHVDSALKMQFLFPLLEALRLFGLKILAVAYVHSRRSDIHLKPMPGSNISLSGRQFLKSLVICSFENFWDICTP